MLLWIQVGFGKDVDLTLPCPVPINDLSAKVGDVGIVELVVLLCQPGPLFRTWMEWLANCGVKCAKWTGGLPSSASHMRLR